MQKIIKNLGKKRVKPKLSQFYSSANAALLVMMMVVVSSENGVGNKDKPQTAPITKLVNNNGRNKDNDVDKYTHKQMDKWTYRQMDRHTHLRISLRNSFEMTQTFVSKLYKYQKFSI